MLNRLYLGLLISISTLLGCKNDRVFRPSKIEKKQKSCDSDFSGRGLYVSETARWVSPGPSRQHFLKALRKQRIEQVVLYGLGPLLQGDSAQALASFLEELRTQGGIRCVGAAVAGLDRVQAIRHFHQVHPQARFDVLVTELEYWNRCEAPASASEGTEPREGCFASMRALLEGLKSLAQETRAQGAFLRTGAYLGYPNAAEVREIAARADFVMLNYAIARPELSWTFRRQTTGTLSERFQAFAATGVKIWPIFYADGEAHMGPWLQAHGVEEAEGHFRQGLAGKHKALGGFQYFGDRALLDRSAR